MGDDQGLREPGPRPHAGSHADPLPPAGQAHRRRARGLLGPRREGAQAEGAVLCPRRGPRRRKPQARAAGPGARIHAGLRPRFRRRLLRQDPHRRVGGEDLRGPGDLRDRPRRSRGEARREAPIYRQSSPSCPSSSSGATWTGRGIWRSRSRPREAQAAHARVFVRFRSETSQADATKRFFITNPPRSRPRIRPRR